jgi:hypothetical protein
MISPLSILTVADDGSKSSYTNNENWSDNENVLLWKRKYSISFKIFGPKIEYDLKLIKNDFVSIKT